MIGIDSMLSYDRSVLQGKSLFQRFGAEKGVQI